MKSSISQVTQTAPAAPVPRAPQDLTIAALTAQQAEMASKVRAARGRVAALQTQIADIKSQMVEPAEQLARDNSLKEERLMILAMARISGETPDTSAIDASLAARARKAQEDSQNTEVLGEAILILERGLKSAKEDMQSAVSALQDFIADLVWQKFVQAEAETTALARSLIDAIGRLQGICGVFGGLPQKKRDARQMAAQAAIWSANSLLPMTQHPGGVVYFNVDLLGRGALAAARDDLKASLSDAMAAVAACEA